MKQTRKRTGTIGTETKQQPKMRQPANLHPDEAAIFQRVKAEGDRGREWENIAESDMDDFSLRDDPMKLPDFAQKLQDAKHYVFRWVTKSKERLDEIRNMKPPFKWWIVNASTMPGSESELDPVLGCVSKLDQLLVFKPWNLHEAQNRYRRQLADAKDQSGDLDKKDGFVPAENIELKAGPEARIQKTDEVMVQEDDVLPGGEAEGFDESEGLDDLVANE